MLVELPASVPVKRSGKKRVSQLCNEAAIFEDFAECHKDSVRETDQFADLIKNKTASFINLSYQPRLYLEPH